MVDCSMLGRSAGQPSHALKSRHVSMIAFGGIISAGLNQAGYKRATLADGPLYLGAPGTIRTSDPQIRSLMLYPAELRAREKRP